MVASRERSPRRAFEPPFLLVLSFSVLALCGCDEAEQRPGALENLIANAELVVAPDGPPGWYAFADEGVDARFSWGEEEGETYLETSIAPGSAEGHARWWFEPVALEGGRFYEYADSSRAHGDGRLIWSCEADGERRFYSAWQSFGTSAWSRTAFRFYVSSPCLVTVMHVLERPGYLQIRRPSLRRVSPAPLPRAFVSLAFDDGRESSRTIAAPELERRGWRGSFYVILHELDRDGFLRRDEVEELARRGHEIGSHSASHRPLIEVPTRELRDEVEGSLLQLAGLGARGGFAYPFGEFDALVEHYVGARARYIRTSLHGLNDATVDLRRIRIHPITSSSTIAEVEAAVEDAAETRSWLVFLLHDLGPLTSDPYQVDPSFFRELLDTVSRHDVEVLPLIEVVERLGR